MPASVTVEGSHNYLETSETSQHDNSGANNTLRPLVAVRSAQA